MLQTKLRKSEVEKLLEFFDIEIEPGHSTKESCPVTSHGKKRGDRDPSLLVKVAKNGSGTVKCYAGCSGEEIKIAVGIKKVPKQLPTYDTRKAVVKAFLRSSDLHGAKVQHYRYTATFSILRFDFPDKCGKQFRAIHKSDSGWVMKGPPDKLPLYHRDELKGKLVYVLEGERCAKLARKLGFIATTSAHGSSSAFKSDWTPLEHFSIICTGFADDSSARMAGEPRHEAIFDGLAGAGGGGVRCS